MLRRFCQVDVFGTAPYRGNPLAVVVDGEGLADDEMRRFANWTNLSETTFLLPPTRPDADYRVRIFTPTVELPFAGHPTLGSCHAWLEHGGDPTAEDVVVQECGIGLVWVGRVDGRLAFTAPELRRSGPVDDELSSRVAAVIGRSPRAVVWADNGPGWVAAELDDADAVLSVTPDFGDGPVFDLGLHGRAAPGLDHDIEVRAFFPGPNGVAEDPVTGSLNAAIARRLMADDPGLRSYVARQGTAIGRDGRVHVTRHDEAIWIGGDVVTCITGSVDI